MKTMMSGLAAGLVLMATAAAPPQAQALDGKVYPGSMCVRYAGTLTPSLSWSAIGNPSNSTWLYLDCPAVHDSINKSVEKGWVRMIDMHFNSNVTCSLNSFYRPSSAGTTQFFGWWTPPISSSGSGGHAQHKAYKGVGSNPVAHYYYSCKIPPKYKGQTSYITSYFVDEKT